MSELEDKLNSLLSDPEQMDKIAKMAKSFMGGAGADGGEESDVQQNDDTGFDMNMMAKIGKLMSGGGREDNDKRALLEAMKPYLGEKRRRKMDRAMKMAKLAKLAGIAFNEYGGD